MISSKQNVCLNYTTNIVDGIYFYACIIMDSIFSETLYCTTVNPKMAIPDVGSMDPSVKVWHLGDTGNVVHTRPCSPYSCSCRYDGHVVVMLPIIGSYTPKAWLC